MLTIIGTVLKKDKKSKSNKAELILQDDFGNQHSFQVRPHKLNKLIEIDTGQRIQISYTTHLAEKLNLKTNDWSRVTYLILEDVKTV